MSQQRPRRFLFCVVGVGAGNTTRDLAILRELESMGPCEIHIAAQGKARELLSQHYEVMSLQDVGYTSGGEFSASSIIRSNLGFPRRFLQNRSRLEEIMRRIRPDVVVADSDFYCLGAARKLGLRLVSINNSAVIVETLKRSPDMPRGCAFSYHVIEKADYWLQRRYPQRVLCPTVVRNPHLPRKFVQIPPMVRPEIQPLDKPGDEVVVLTGGSGIDTANIDLRGVTLPVRMLGTSFTKVPPGAKDVGFTLDVMEHLRAAKVLVIQGGFSSISEALALRVPTVVLPIENHAEQWANGRQVEGTGIGLSAPRPAQAGEYVNRILADYDRFWEATRRFNLRTDGHQVAARMLWRWAGR